MVSIPPEFAGFLGGVGGIFAVNPQYLVFPHIIGLFILPIILNTLGVRFILSKFRVPGVIAWLIGGASAFFTLPYGNYIMYVSVVMIGATRDWGLVKKILFIVLVEAGLWFGLPMLIDILSKGIVSIPRF